MKDFRNGLLHRREVNLMLNSEKNPGFEESLKKISENFKSPEENIAMKSVKSKFGRDTFLIKAFIYDSVEHKNIIEPKLKVKKKAEGAA